MFLAWSQPVTLVLIGATGQALMLPFLGVAAVRFNRDIDPRLRGPLWEIGRPVALGRCHGRCSARINCGRSRVSFSHRDTEHTEARR